MYFNKFSSGTILALLALSGMLFLVPFAVPAHAAGNASLPTVKTTPTLVLQETPTDLKEVVTNPASNAFAIQTITFVAPSGFNFTTPANAALNIGSTGTWCSNAGYSFTTVAVSTSAIECGTGSLPPGFSATFSTAGTVDIQGPASPKSSAPVTGSFTTSVSDASLSGAYPGPSWTETSIAAGGALVSPAHTGETVPTITVTGNPTTYTAGSAAVTVTATLATPAQPGVTVAFSAANGAYPTAPATTTFSPSSGATSAGGVVTTSWQPSNTAGDNTQIKVSITGSAFSGTGAQLTTTAAGAPTTVTFYLGAPVFPATNYVTAFVACGAASCANIAGPGSITYAATDAFGNAAGAGVTGGTLTAANGYFLGTPGTTTCGVTGTCGAYSVVPQYTQSGVYGTIGQISATLTGAGFSVSGSSGFIQTSTFANSASFVYPSAPATVNAGTGVDYKVLLNVVQTGVPVKIQVCVHSACGATSKGYSGSFSNTLSSISGVTNSSGSFGSVFTISSKLNAAVEMNATVSQPVNGASNPQSFTNAFSNTITTGPGAAAKFQLYATFLNGQGSGNSGPSTNTATSGATLYVDAILTDAYGNIVSNALLQQIQINMGASGVSGGGLLSATNIYLSSGCSSTNQTGIVGTCLGSFGPVAWTLPATLGASTVTATAVINGVAITGSITVTTISSLPTLNVKSPAPVNGVIYSSSQFVTFSGKANASLGYPSTVQITSIGYKVNSLPWVQSSVAAANKVVWSVPVTLSTGLSTIQFNATDSKSNVAVSSSYQVLVDSAAPVFAFGSATSNTGCTTVTATTSAGDFNTATSGSGSFTATFGGVAVPASGISWTGTQTLGSPSTLTATICGLVSQAATFTVSGSTLTGVTGTASETLTVTVPFANSITFNTGTATYGLNGAFKGVTVSVNNGWNTAQTIVVYATLKLGSNIYVADGTVTVGAGGTASVFCIDLQAIPAGSYSVTFAAVTTANQAVSAPTTAITLVAT